MKVGEVILVSVVITVIVGIGFEIARPKGARIFSKGKNGETDLAFDPTTAPKKTP